MLSKPLSYWGILAILLTICGQITAQTEGEVSLATPRAAIYTHLYFLQSDSYDAEKSALAVPEVENREELARQIKQVLDAKGLFVAMSKIPKDSNYVDTEKQSKYILFPIKLPEVYLEKQGGDWRYSAETAEMIPILHSELYPMGSEVLLNIFPRMGTGKFLGLMVWQYLGFAIFLIVGFLFYLIFTKILDVIMTRMAKSRLSQEYFDPALIHKIARLIGLIIVVTLIGWFSPVLQLPVKFSAGLMTVLSILKYVFFILLGLRLIDFLMYYATRFTEKTDSRMDDQLLLIVKRILQIILVVFGIISILNLLNVNVAALVAGVSVGGLAIALAAQDSVKNLIGALMIFIDKPFDVGDYVIAGNVSGVVQEVGFRSTRLQASDTSMISVPNGKMVDMTINNLGRRVYRRYRTQIGINYDTPPDIIDIFVEGIEGIMAHHPHTLDEKTEVHLTEFGPSSLDIMLQTFINVDSWSEELRTKQNIMVEILKLAGEMGVDFAFPSQSLYVESLPGNEKVNRPRITKEEASAIMKSYVEKHRKS